MLRRDIKDYHFRADAHTGLTMRWGKTLHDNPSWAPVPELADLSISNHCSKECAYCYRESARNNDFLSVNDYCKVLDAMRHPEYGNVFQVAIGGGEPLEHPDFVKIIDATLERGIVPNFTTNGIFLTEDVCRAIQGKVGAVALSVTSVTELQEEKIAMLRKYTIRTNIHYVLSAKNIEEAIEIVSGKYEAHFAGVNAIIFLTYKPAGRGTKEDALRRGEQLDRFVKMVNAHQNKGLKIGFDACFVPNLLHAGFGRPELVDVCEAGYFSVYVDHKMNVSPCSFSGGRDAWSLKEYDFYDIWVNMFKGYRNRQKNRCEHNDCVAHEVCRGCCPYYPQITTCYDN